jgi:hypothetical protein
MTRQFDETFAEFKTPANPFPGLRPFELYESHLFFGRDGQSERLISKLSHNRFLAVVGTSSSGKSSLVRAGLLPALHGGFMTDAGSGWRIAIMRPGNDPIGNLAQALNDPEVFGPEREENAAVQAVIVGTTLRRGSGGLAEVVRQAAMPPEENLLVVVDQFEEIFRFASLAQDETFQNEAAAFVKLVLEASLQSEVPVYIVLTMRSDYLGDCSRFWGLPEAINESQYLIPRLTRDQLREAITGPIAVAGGTITPSLLNQLLNDVGSNSDQLPILQHALSRTWDLWKRESGAEGGRGESLNLRIYEAVGGMGEALSRHADEAFNELPGDRSREIAEEVFKCLTGRDSANREIRRPATLGEICAVTGATRSEVINVIETFRRPGRSFVMPPAYVPLDENSLIDISHESLIRGWQRLRYWVDEEAQSARTYHRLAETAALHAEGGAGLWRDPDLQLALNWRERNKPNQAWARRYHPDFDLAMNFLEQSRATREAEIMERERRRKRETQRSRSLLVLLVMVLSLIVLILFISRR